MYSVTFVKRERLIKETYFYNTEKDAIKHADLFIDDTSGLYKKIIVLNEDNNTVIKLIIFEETGVKVLAPGVVVKYNSGYCKSEEKYLLFTVTNINDINMRCTIMCINSGMSIPPCELVGVEMIDVC